MSSSLDKLSGNLARSGQSHFMKTKKHFKINDLYLVTRKGVYFYKDTDS